VAHGDSPGGPRRSAGGFRRKSIVKLVSDTERMKNTPTHIYICIYIYIYIYIYTHTHTHISVLKLPLLVDVQQKVGELVISVTSCPSFTILENTLN
jgi:hypothetical protein